MTGNRSLDEFLGDDEAAGLEEAGATAAAETAEPSGSAGGGEGATGADAVDASSVEPMAITYARSSDGGPCAACGRTAEVRWRADAGLVCPDCKAW